MALAELIDRPRPSWFSRLIADPYTTAARSLYDRRYVPSQVPRATPVTVVCISDTHNARINIPDGDVLIHSGDLTQSGSFEELQAALDWLNELPHRYKIAIAGNHDLYLDKSISHMDRSRKLDWGSIRYLQDTSVVLKFAGSRSIKLYGSPMTPKHGNWAFEYPRGQDVFSNKVPKDTDILVTHGPPKCHLDLGRYGDEYLLGEVERVRPKLHVFGHIHEGYGRDFFIPNSTETEYQYLLSGRGGILALIRLLCAILYDWTIGGRLADRGTLLVNAAIVGGLRDHLRRDPTVITL